MVENDHDPGAATIDSRRVDGSGGSDADFQDKTAKGPRTIGDPDAEVVFYANDERYQAKRRLGEGGMGEVRLCRDRVIGREVAMKVVHPTVQKRTETHHRFVREARVQGQLEHPAIVPVYDFGLDKDGNAFFTMRRVRGVTLEQILDSLRDGKDEETKKIHTRHKLLAAFVRVCLAIEFAHEYGVLHRDLKPANIMLGRHGEVYVLDWGLAKVRSASKSIDATLKISAELESARRIALADAGVDPMPSEKIEISGVQAGQTAHGSVLGTPQYMAPEQIRGEDIDGRVDVYALGAILFEILTLEPLQGSGTIAAILLRALKGVEARASVRVPDAEVAPELEQACMRATSLERSARYDRARDLGDAIEAYLSGDRDLEMRRGLAKEHLGRARDVIAKKSAASSELTLTERSDALQEVGRALALSPNDPDALALLVGFLTEPPSAPVKEVTERIEKSTRESQRRMLPAAAAAYGVTALIFIPLQMAVGVNNVWLALVPLFLWIEAGAAALLYYRFAAPEQRTFPLVTLSSSLALAASSLLHGPLMLVPAIGAIVTMGQVLQTPRHNRVFLVACNLMAVGVPTLLACLDIHPVHYVFPDGGLAMSGGALRFSPQMLALLGFMHLVFIVVGAHFVGVYRDQLRALQNRVQLQAWQLEQLVPIEARAIQPALRRAK